MTQQTITASGSGTFTVPAGITSLTIEAWGAGGGGSGTATASAPGGAGGGYSTAVISVSPGQTVFFNVGSGGPGGANGTGTSGGDSWVNPAANSEPLSGGVVGGGGNGAGSTGHASGGAGSIGTTNFTGGNGGDGGGQGGGTGGGGGGGAGSAGNGGNGVDNATQQPASGGAGGTPDGGAGSTGTNGAASTATQPGGGGGGSWLASGGNGADGQVRFSWTLSLLATNLTNVPGKHFTKKQFGDLLSEIRDEAIAQNQLLEGLSDKERADLDFDVARLEFEELENNLGPTNYAKAMAAKEKMDKTRKTRDHHYFMEIVNQELAKYNGRK